MGFWNTVGRVATGAATLGLSETDAGKRIGQSLGLSKPDVKPIPTPDTSALDAEGQRARDAYQQFLIESHGQNFSAPQIAAAHAEAVQNTRMPEIGGPSTYLANTIQDPTKVSVIGLPGATQGVKATQASAAGAVAANIDDSAGQQIRGQQLTYLDALGQAAAGKAPSAADAQFEKGLGQTVTTQLGAVGQARGSDRAAQRREAMLAIGKQGQEAALSAAQLKAQETATARGQLGSALSDVRGVDTSTAVRQAELKNTTSINNANTETSTSVGNADRTLDASKFTASSQNDRDVLGAKMRLDADTGNVTRAVDADKYNAGAITAVSKDNITNSNERQEYIAGLQNKVDTANADRNQATNDKNAGFVQDTSKTNATNTLLGKEINDKAASDLRSDALTASSQSLNATGHALDTKTGITTQNINNQNSANAQGLDRLKSTVVGGASAIATGGASLATSAPGIVQQPQAQTAAAPSQQKATPNANADGSNPNDPDDYTSDKRAKKNIKRESDKDVSDFINALELYSYKYKNPQVDGSGNREGVMAQDLEKSKIGRTVVRNDNGKKVVDTGALTMAMAGVLARVAKDARRAGGRR